MIITTIQNDGSGPPTIREHLSRLLKFISLFAGATIMTQSALAAPNVVSDPNIDPQVRSFLEQINKDPRCLIPSFNGAIFSSDWKDGLWDKFCTAAPRRQRQSVEQYKIVKRA
ncbi:hypothetical protein [Mesorhizobium sp. B4-1-4]|uniref:hypothetical protein n=1 Tax=Mesorhizobium sp. B4-1-4 TaxID=2589888 RepID=UPI00112695BB|nr:hypothetical protein [Mesorhizobium sp. B4-1-4]UCI32239.1 hypothetical protein FJW03_01900 [Mesorhizobium sp. B4-1-4]